MDLSLGEWFVEGRLNYTKTESNVFLPITRDIGLSTTTYDLSNIEDPIVNVFELGTQTPLDPALVDYSLANLGIIYAAKMDADVTKVKLDAQRELSIFGRDAIFQLGLQTDTREADGYTNLGIGASPRRGGIDVEAFNSGIPWESATTNSIGGTYYDNPGLRRAWEASPVWSIPTPPDDELVSVSYTHLTLPTTWGV